MLSHTIFSMLTVRYVCTVQTGVINWQLYGQIKLTDNSGKEKLSP